MFRPTFLLGWESRANNLINAFPFGISTKKPFREGKIKTKELSGVIALSAASASAACELGLEL